MTQPLAMAGKSPARPSAGPSSAPAGAAGTNPEQRRSRRQVFITFAWYGRVREAGDSSAPVEEGLAQSCDISERGIGLVTGRSIAVGARLFVEIASDAGMLSLVARVTRCTESDGKYRIGLDVEIVPPNDRPTLARILSA